LKFGLSLRRNWRLWLLLSLCLPLVAEAIAQSWALAQRNRWRPEQLAAGTAAKLDPSGLRVLALGHSLTLGAEVPVERRFTYLLEEDLRRRLKGAESVRVLNEGRPGWSTAQQLKIAPSLIELHRPTQVLLWTGLHDTYSLLDVESEVSGLAWLAEYSRLARMLEILIFDWRRTRDDLQDVSAEAGWVHASSKDAETQSLSQSTLDQHEAVALSETQGRLSALKWIDDPRARVRAWLGFTILEETLLRRRSTSSLDQSSKLDRETAEALLRDSSGRQVWDPALVAMARSMLQFADLQNDQAAVEELKAFGAESSSSEPPNLPLMWRPWLQALQRAGINDPAIQLWLRGTLPSRAWDEGPAWEKISADELENVWRREPAWGRLAMHVSARRSTWREKLDVLFVHRRANPTSFEGTLLLNRLMHEMHGPLRSALEEEWSKRIRQESRDVQAVLRTTWIRADNQLIGSKTRMMILKLWEWMRASSVANHTELILMGYPPSRVRPEVSLSVRLKDLNEALMRAAHDADPPLRFVNLDEAWRRDRAKTGRRLDAYYWDQKRPWDLHLSEVGHQLVAQTLSDLWAEASSEGQAR